MKNFILAVSILFNILFLVRYFVLRAQEKEPTPQMIADIGPAAAQKQMAEVSSLNRRVLCFTKSLLTLGIPKQVWFCPRLIAEFTFHS